MEKFIILLAGLFILHGIAFSQSVSMTVDGGQQGKFRGENATGGSDKIDVVSLSLEVSTLTAAGSGLASGRRQHQPFVVKKMTGAASPQFLQALVTNETLKRVIIEYKTGDMNTGDSQTFTITLENIKVAGFKQATEVPANAKAQKSTLFDEIKLVYQKITVESTAGGTTATDDTGAQIR